MTIMTVNEVSELGINEPDVAALKASHEWLRGCLMCLLARIHRDGGQWTEAIGLEASAIEAGARIAVAYAQADELRGENARIESNFYGMSVRCDAVRADRDALRARVATLEEALRTAARAMHDAAMAGGNRDVVDMSVFADDLGALAGAEPAEPKG